MFLSRCHRAHCNPQLWGVISKPSDNKVPLAPEVLQRMNENLVQMTQYCENNYDCRRFLLLKV